jgi:DNA-binding beta-propeller fold protein YncE
MWSSFAPASVTKARSLLASNGTRRGRPIPAGALPDMLTFTPDGRTLLVANEGEPNDLYSVDPEGSVTVIDFDRGPGNPRVRTARFAGVPFEGPVRLFGFNSPTPAQDLEPEYIATDGSSAWVTLQENNAIALMDVDSANFSKVKGVGFKDHGAADNGIDASDRDNGLPGSTLPSRLPARPMTHSC